MNCTKFQCFFTAVEMLPFKPLNCFPDRHDNWIVLCMLNVPFCIIPLNYVTCPLISLLHQSLLCHAGFLFHQCGHGTIFPFSIRLSGGWHFLVYYGLWRFVCLIGLWLITTPVCSPEPVHSNSNSFLHCFETIQVCSQQYTLCRAPQLITTLLLNCIVEIPMLDSCPDTEKNVDSASLFIEGYWTCYYLRSFFFLLPFLQVDSIIFAKWLAFCRKTVQHFWTAALFSVACLQMSLNSGSDFICVMNKGMNGWMGCKNKLIDW